MTRTIIATISAFEYQNFKQENSEKNVINQIWGNEYVVDTASKTILEDINEIPTTINVTPLDGGDRVYVISDWSNVPYAFFNNIEEMRAEYYYISGSFTIETDQVLSNEKSITVTPTIYYDEYYKENVDLVNLSNLDSENSLYKSIMTDDNKRNSDGLLSAEGNLPYEPAVNDLYHGALGLTHTTVNTPSQLPSNRIKITTKKLANGHYLITTDYLIYTWWGCNHSQVTVFGWHGAYWAKLFVARRIEFSITANTVSAREIEFDYSRPSDENYANVIGKTYALESNEFIQTDDNQDIDGRTSYAISQEIFDKFDQDRSIVSFTLLNCEKYQVGDTYRYLRSEDLIYLEDENGELISDEINANGELVPSIFEIIKTRPIWDGAFSMEVVCRKIDMTT